MININDKFYIREEVNGITVYEKETNYYKFYENLTLSEIKDEKSFAEKTPSKNIIFTNPFRVNWLIEENCNLDCIYCFADDKMSCKETKDNILSTVKHIKNLGILNVGLSGGEPTLNPHIKEIIESFNNEISINLDTNGTTKELANLAPVLKEANVLVRITLDSINEDIINKLRPSKVKLNQLEMIKQNIKILQSHDVNIMIHTVVTQMNKEYLLEVAESLVDMGINRWHLYGVDYSLKCKDNYNKLIVNQKELNEIYEKLKLKYKDKLEISAYFDEKTYNANAIILINSQGEFYVDTIKQGIKYIGKNVKKPTSQEINQRLNQELHCNLYLY